MKKSYRIWRKDILLNHQLNLYWSALFHTHEDPKSLINSPVQGGSGKSLARHTSWCCGMESIVSLERGVCSCAELQVFSCYRGWKEACQATRAISTTSRRELSSFIYLFFSVRQSAEGNSRHSDRNVRGTCAIVFHRQKLGGPVETWWFFRLCCTSSWTTQNSHQPGDYY